MVRGGELNITDVQRSIDGHLAAGRLLGDRSSGRLTLAPAMRAEVESRIDAGRELEDTVRAEWAASLAAAGYGTEEIEAFWECLRGYMARAFRQHGALAVQLLDPNVPTAVADVASLGSYLDESIHETCPSFDLDVVRREVVAFFGTMTPARSRYVAQLLDGTFTFFALTVNEATAAYLRDSLSALKLFLDTNFIFGLLGTARSSMVPARVSQGRSR